MARQEMASRDQPERASLSKYLMTICRSIMLNLLRGSSRSREDLVAEPDRWQPVAVEADDPADLLEHLADLEVEGTLPPLAPVVARHLLEGRQVREVATALGVEAVQGREAVTALREVVSYADG